MTNFSFFQTPFYQEVNPDILNIEYNEVSAILKSVRDNLQPTNNPKETSVYFSSEIKQKIKALLFQSKNLTKSDEDGHTPLFDIHYYCTQLKEGLPQELLDDAIAQYHESLALTAYDPNSKTRDEIVRAVNKGESEKLEVLFAQNPREEIALNYIYTKQSRYNYYYKGDTLLTNLISEMSHSYFDHPGLEDYQMQLRSLKTLLKHGANPNLPCFNELYSRTPLFLAVMVGNRKLTKLLIKHGADVSQRGERDGVTSAHFLCSTAGTCNEERPAIMKLLLRKGASPWATSAKGPFQYDSLNVYETAKRMCTLPNNWSKKCDMKILRDNFTTIVQIIERHLNDQLFPKQDRLSNQDLDSPTSQPQITEDTDYKHFLETVDDALDKLVGGPEDLDNTNYLMTRSDTQR